MSKILRIIIVSSIATAALSLLPATSLAAGGRVACIASAHTAGCVTNEVIVKHKIAAGKATACAVLADTRLACWGNNSDGQAVAPQGTGFASVAAGAYHGCSIKTNNSIVCWGDNHFRQSTVGGGTCSPTKAESTPDNICPEPAASALDLKAIDISAGKFHTCAVLTDQSIACWGLNVDMNGDPAGQSLPPGGDFAQVSAGGYHTCGLRIDGSIACWGGNWDLQADAPSGTDFAQVAAGRTHTCALRRNGTIVCWGVSTNGRATPPSGNQFTAIASSYDNTCALKRNGSIVCWGANDAGQLKAPSGKFTALALGGNSAIALRNDGIIVGWGDNRDGQASTPVGSVLGGPSMVAASMRGLGHGFWRVGLSARAGTRPVKTIQIWMNTARPSDSASTTTGVYGYRTSIQTRGSRPRWIRVGDTVGRWSEWIPIQVLLG